MTSVLMNDVLVRVYNMFSSYKILYLIAMRSKSVVNISELCECLKHLIEHYNKA